ncbi:MAG: hypothetical protein MO852_06015 [Candidatus Devosia euplotis]|nr:hypothetical protein [Candidatus Devosia euplotis]
MSIPATYKAISLAGRFALTSPTSDIAGSVDLPGDVHAALLAAGKIVDPYYGENEKQVMWINETAWSVERSFAAA